MDALDVMPVRISRRHEWVIEAVAGVFVDDAPHDCHGFRPWKLEQVARLAAKQGWDAGRFAPGQASPYARATTRAGRVAAYAWALGQVRGLAVEPRPQPQPVDPRPIRLLDE